MFIAADTSILVRFVGFLSPAQGDVGLAVRSSCIYATTVLHATTYLTPAQQSNKGVLSVPFLSLCVFVMSVLFLSVCVSLSSHVRAGMVCFKRSGVGENIKMSVYFVV